MAGSGGGTKPPEGSIKYHVTPEWDETDLQPAIDRFGEQGAVELFMQKWDTEDASYALDQITKVYLHDTLEAAREHQRDYGGEILIVDTSELDVIQDMTEGYPVSAIRGSIPKSAIKRRIDRK